MEKYTRAVVLGYRQIQNSVQYRKYTRECFLKKDNAFHITIKYERKQAGQSLIRRSPQSPLRTNIGRNINLFFRSFQL